MTSSSTAATPMAFVRTMVLAFEKYKEDPSKALEIANIEPSMLHQTAARITAAQMEIFSESAMRQLDDEALGWFSRKLPWGSYGMLCRASIGSPNLFVALRRWCRHHQLLVDDVALSLQTDGQHACLQIEEVRNIDPRMREFCFLTLLRNLHGFACWAIDSRIPVLRATFSHSPPLHHTSYSLMFPGPVHFDSASTGICFEKEYLYLPIRRDEDALRTMLRRALPLIVLQYRKDRLLVERVRALLSQQQTAETVASALNISVRTLHRQLKEHGTTLQSLKDQVRRDLAVQLLTRTTRSIKQIALSVSFQNEKSFTRAFCQWTGLSPDEYRRSLLEEGRRMPP